MASQVAVSDFDLFRAEHRPTRRRTPGAPRRARPGRLGSAKESNADAGSRPFVHPPLQTAQARGESRRYHRWQDERGRPAPANTDLAAALAAARAFARRG